MSSISCARIAYVDTSKQTVFILTPFWSPPLVFGMSFGCLPSRWSRLACGLRSVLRGHQKIGISFRKSAGIAGTESTDIIRDEQARGDREKAYPVRFAQECSRDGGCVTWTCQLLHRRDTDRER